MNLPFCERSRWRDGTVSLVEACQAYASGVSTIAVESRRARLAVGGSNDGGISLVDTRDLSKAPRSVVQSMPSRLMSAGTLLDMPRATPSSLSEGGHEGRVEPASRLPEDDVLFVTGGDESVKIWDASDLQKCVVAMDLHAKVHSTCVTHSPKALAAAALGDATVRLIDLRTGRAVNTLQGHSAPVLCLSWGEPCSRQLFSGGFDGTVRA